MRSSIHGLIMYSLVGLFIIFAVVPEPNAFYPVSAQDVAIEESLQETTEAQDPPVPTIEAPHVVSSGEKLAYKDIDIFCLAKNIYHEAGIEPEEGKYAVAQVTLNRVNHPKYPNTVCDVVMDPYQFSWANKRSLRWTRPKGPNWEESLRIAKTVLEDGYRHTGLDRVKYYHADYVHPRWANKLAMRTVIGRHIFYEDTRAY
jgi:spore germination cell wall hydrolase CwlJ-like protein